MCEKHTNLIGLLRLSLKQMSDLRPAAERLADYIKGQQVIHFVSHADDKEYPYIKLSILGAILTNELFVKLTNGRVEFVAFVPSPLIYPVMSDRRFGIDVSDHSAAIKLAEELWELHKHQLLTRVE